MITTKKFNYKTIKLNSLQKCFNCGTAYEYNRNNFP